MGPGEFVYWSDEIVRELTVPSNSLKSLQVYENWQNMENNSWHGIERSEQKAVESTQRKSDWQ